jgi:hypothetical protein
MRSYIFTDDEIEGLLAWLRTGDEDDTLRMTFVGIRRNFRVLMIHMELMVLVEKELRRQGRFDRRMRLPRELRERMAVTMEDPDRHGRGPEREGLKEGEA